MQLNQSYDQKRLVEMSSPCRYQHSIYLFHIIRMILLSYLRINMSRTISCQLYKEYEYQAVAFSASRHLPILYGVRTGRKTKTEMACRSYYITCMHGS